MIDGGNIPSNYNKIDLKVIERAIRQQEFIRDVIAN